MYVKHKVTINKHSQQWQEQQQQQQHRETKHSPVHRHADGRVAGDGDGGIFFPPPRSTKKNVVRTRQKLKKSSRKHCMRLTRRSGNDAMSGYSLTGPMFKIRNVQHLCLPSFLENKRGNSLNRAYHIHLKHYWHSAVLPVLL
ncbi:unnamed protein product [Ectocarpus sp. 8 AP-2014]